MLVSDSQARVFLKIKPFRRKKQKNEKATVRVSSQDQKNNSFDKPSSNAGSTDRHRMELRRSTNQHFEVRLRGSKKGACLD